jgi:hypothetical protein
MSLVLGVLGLSLDISRLVKQTLLSPDTTEGTAADPTPFENKGKLHQPFKKQTHLKISK